MMKITKGEKQPLEPDDAGLLSDLQSLRKMQAEAAALAEETGYISDELIAERRAEAVKEALRCLLERKRER